jgi:hypothetical protein
MTTIHPAFTGCLLALAFDASHAWKIMTALDAAGFRAGYPAIIDGKNGVAVTGDAYSLEAVEAIRASVAR